jgi:hypothetical protein
MGGGFWKKTWTPGTAATWPRSSWMTASTCSRWSRGWSRRYMMPLLLEPRPAKLMNCCTAGWRLTIAATFFWCSIMA